MTSGETFGWVLTGALTLTAAGLVVLGLAWHRLTPQQRRARAQRRRYAKVPLGLPPKEFSARLKAIDTQLDKEYTMPATPEGYCMKCRAMTEMKHPLPAMLGKGGRAAIKGNCAVCGTKTSRILRKGEHAD